MGKAPAYQHYVKDWIADLSEHPLEIEGAWIAFCSRAWLSDERGVLTKTLHQWASIFRSDVENAIRILAYIEEEKIGDVTPSLCDMSHESHARVTVASRRMVRDEKERKSSRLRKQKERERNASRECHAKVTPPSSSSSASAKNNTPPPPSSHSEKIRSILPPSLPWNLWVEYRKHRRKTKGGMTEHAEELMAKKLARFAAEGHDPVFLVNGTIEKGWKDINPEWLLRDNGGKPVKPEVEKIECPSCGQRHEPHVVEREGGMCPACGRGLTGEKRWAEA